MSTEVFSEAKFPSTYREFVQTFLENKDCLDYLKILKWPTGFICPKCQSTNEPWEQTRNRLVCKTCRHQTTIVSGTIFQKTRTPLTTWFEAAWHITTAKNGFSAKNMERTLGVCYRTAWTILQRYRVAMVRSEREKLVGRVEIDESFSGGVKVGGKRGRGSEKLIIAIAVEIKEPKGFGRIRMGCIPDASEASLLTFIESSVTKGATIHTDGWKGYHNISKNGFLHDVTVQSTSGSPAHISMPAVHRISSLFKRWILGTHQGSMSAEHARAYLEEYTFRFNRRTSKSRGHLFKRLMEQAVVTSPIIIKDISKGYNWKTQDAGAGGSS